jgi:transcription elongation factor Elf1
MSAKFSIKYLYCMACGQRQQVSGAYMAKMQKDRDVHCGFCHSHEVRELSPATWKHWALADSMSPVDVQMKNIGQLAHARKMMVA